MHHIDFEELAVSRFGIKTDLAAQIPNASADAKREHLRVVLVLGDPQSPSTQMLLKTVARYEVDKNAVDRNEADAELTRMLADFRLVYIDVHDQDAAAHLAKCCQFDVARLDLPAFAVLGEDGLLAERQSIAVAGDLPQFDVEGLREFLKRNALPPRNAEELMRRARRRALDENKRILLQHSSPGSYPCRLLTRYIERHLNLLERDYIYVNIDAYRSIKGTEVIEQFRKPGGAVPWLAILNSDGFKLADSDSPAGNIGFPAEPEAINYFIDQMLKPTAERLTAKDFEELRSALSKQE